MILAAVVDAVGQPFRLAKVELDPPGPGRVRVSLAATGVCHSDLSLANGTMRQALPAVLGHEGAGRVVEVGDGVTKVAPGDHVALCWAPPCRECWFCLQHEPHLCERSSEAWSTPYGRLDGQPVYPGLGTAAFATETVVGENAVVPIPRDVPLEQAALLGCAVLTGVGAVVNTARVQPGQSVLVVGLGGVGLSVVQGARIAGATVIVAVDPDPGKADLARRLGATDVLPAGPDIAKQVRGLTGGRGADHAFECVGRGATIRQAWSSTRRGGMTTIVGIGGKDQAVEFHALELFHFGRTITGCVYGSMDPDRDIPIMVEHLRTGALDLEGLITRRIALEDLESAFTEMSSGHGARSLVVFE